MGRLRGRQVTPGSNHGRPSESFTVDQNGKPQASSSNGRTHPSAASTGGSIPERLRRGRAAVRWPFQSVVSENTTVELGTCSSPTATTAPTLLTGALGRRFTAALPAITSNRRRLFHRGSGDDTNSVMRDLVPDYVINYIRGETAESVARRVRNRGYLGKRKIELVQGGLEGIREGHVAHLSGADGMGTDGPSSGIRGPLLSGEGEDHWLGSGASRRRAHAGRGEGGGAKGWRRLGVGWRLGVVINGVVALVTQVLAAIWLTLAITKTTHLFPGPFTIYSGSCGTAASIDWGLHAVLSVLAVVVMAGANYTFQVLCSPLRTEIDEAHAKKKCLDIGIASLRNLLHIKRLRAVLAVSVVAVAVITQVIYNALIFTSQPGVELQTVIVTSSFVQGAGFSNTTASNSGNLTRADILALQDDAEQGKLVNLTTTACLVDLGGVFETNYSAVILVTNSSSPSSLVQTLVPGTSLSSLSHTETSMTVDSATVQYCLAQKATVAITCHVYLNSSLVVVIVTLNILTFWGAITVLLGNVTLHPLVTLGDAVSSFLQEPDPATRGCCLLSKGDVHHNRWGLRKAKRPTPGAHWWFRSASPARWAAFALPWASMAGLAAAALVLAGLRPTYDQTKDRSSNISKTPTAFGTPNPYATYLVSDSWVFPAPMPALAAALVASLPQIFLAGLYLTTNSLLTAYFLSHESSLYAVAAQPLRVSADPDGAQVTSLYLTMPRPLSWLLLVLFSASGFALSQSIFVVHLREQSGSSSSPAAENALVGVGLSGAGLIVLLVLLAAVGALVFGLGLRRAPSAMVRSELASAGAADGVDRLSRLSRPSVIGPGTPGSELPAIVRRGRGNPLALPGGSCSAVISARCHRMPAETDVWSRPVAWGVVHEGGGTGAGHAAYTAGEKLRMVDVGKTYA